MMQSSRYYQQNVEDRSGRRRISTKVYFKGGILSPLLSNIILNQLDWWVSTQWEDLPVKNKRYVHQKRRILKVDISLDMLMTLK